MRSISYFSIFIALLGLSTATNAFVNQLNDRGSSNWASVSFSQEAGDGCTYTIGELGVIEWIEKTAGDTNTYPYAFFSVFSYNVCTDEYRFGYGDGQVTLEQIEFKPNMMAAKLTGTVEVAFWSKWDSATMTTETVTINANWAAKKEPAYHSSENISGSTPHGSYLQKTTGIVRDAIANVSVTGSTFSLTSNSEQQFAQIGSATEHLLLVEKY